MVTERAPYGVFGAITPTTNPTETIINNGIGMLAGGNAVVFNTHPSAWRVCGWLVHLLNEAIVGAGGPENLLCSVAEPTIESAQALMRHPLVRILAVTGGPGVVKEAMNSGKRAIAAGPGNPPAVVDETAHLDVAARGIVEGASIDNNIICTAEKEVLAVSSICDRLKELLVAEGCYLMNDKQVRQLEGVVLEGDHTNKKFVGKNAGVILKQIGVHVGDDVRLAICEVPEEHPFVQHELLMPVLGIVRYPDVAAAIAGAKRVEHGFGHTAVMYGTNIDALSAMARTINTSIFVKNGLEPQRPGLSRRRLHLVHHRIADRRRPHHRRQLHARAALHAQGPLPLRLGGDQPWARSFCRKSTRPSCSPTCATSRRWRSSSVRSTSAWRSGASTSTSAA